MNWIRCLSAAGLTIPCTLTLQTVKHSGVWKIGSGSVFGSCLVSYSFFGSRNPWLGRSRRLRQLDPVVSFFLFDEGRVRVVER